MILVGSVEVARHDDERDAPRRARRGLLHPRAGGPARRHASRSAWPGRSTPGCSSGCSWRASPRAARSSPPSGSGKTPRTAGGGGGRLPSREA